MDMPFEMLSEEPFWMIVRFWRERASWGQRVAGGDFGSIFYASISTLLQGMCFANVKDENNEDVPSSRTSVEIP